MGVGTAIGIGSGIAAGGALGAGAIQSGAANNAAGLQYQLGEQSLAFQQQEYNQQQQNLAPWLQAGKGALSQLGTGLGIGTGGVGPLNAPFTQQFNAPTAVEAQNYPGYQFQLQQGQNAVQNSAAARGGLVSGNAATALNNYSQQAGQSDYNNVYNEAMQQYLNSFNIYNSNQTNQYNRLASLAGVGQNAATTLGQQGQAAAGNIAGINSSIGSQVGQNINNAGAATASGYAGAANAGSSLASNLGLYQLLGSLGGQQPPTANMNSTQFQNYFQS